MVQNKHRLIGWRKEGKQPSNSAVRRGGREGVEGKGRNAGWLQVPWNGEDPDPR